jgi:hypothetical protein
LIKQHIEHLSIHKMLCARGGRLWAIGKNAPAPRAELPSVKYLTKCQSVRCIPAMGKSRYRIGMLIVSITYARTLFDVPGTIAGIGK